MNSEVIEVSKRLEGLAVLLDAGSTLSLIPRDIKAQWAADIRSLVIPQPVDEHENN